MCLLASAPGWLHALRLPLTSTRWRKVENWITKQINRLRRDGDRWVAFILDPIESPTPGAIQPHTQVKSRPNGKVLGNIVSMKYITISYSLSREYRVVRYRYSRLFFTSEYRLCANLRVQEQSTHMTSQCECPTFAWRHIQTVVTSQ